MRFDFTGRTALVTGASQGIGLAIARYLADAGALVGMVDVNGESLERAAASVEGATPFVADVADAGAIEAVTRQLNEAGGGLHVLVNNAGVLRDRMLWRLTQDDWDQVLRVHLTGTFVCTKAAAVHMRAAGYGRIINLTSYVGLHGNVGQANYAAAKAGIIGFTRTAAKELAPAGVTVNAISPNAATAMVDSIPPAQRAAIEAQIPLGRFGDPSEMAPAVAFLASDAASYITGVVLPVDGGLAI